MEHRHPRWARYLGRLLVPVAIVGSFALVNDAANAQLAGQRYCLDDGLAATSPAMTEQMCVTLGIDAPVPQPFTEVVSQGSRAVWDPLSAEVRRGWARYVG